MTVIEARAPEVDSRPTAPAGVRGAGMWTGAGERATFTWLHTPENGRTRGLVVIAPPVGREHVQAYRPLRQLAMLLTGAGYCVARVSYRGVGDSHALSPEEDLLAEWERNILDATRQAREVCGIEDLPVFGIGYRVVAWLLTRCAEHFDRVLAWEPVSGAVFVKQWARLRRATLPEIPVGEGVDLMGLWLTDEQARQLSTLTDPRKLPELPGNVEIHREQDQPRAKVMYGVESLDVRVHYDVLEDLLWRLPRPQLVDAVGGGRGPQRNVFRAPSGELCAEEIVVVDPQGYPGVLTGPVQGEAAAVAPWPGKPTTFFAPGASEPRDGSTLWSETARRLAGQGVVSLRADRDGAGDHALLWSDRDPNPYRYLNAQALREQAQWLADHFHTDVVATVLCSGAWAALRAAREPAGIAATSMVLVSQNEWRMNQKFFDELRLSYDGDAKLRAKTAARPAEASGPPPGSRHGDARTEPGRAASAPHGAERAAARTVPERARTALSGARVWATDRLGDVKQAGSLALRHHTPEPVWNLMARSPAASIPDHVLERASRNRSATLLVGPDDEPRYRETMADRAVTRLQRRGRDIHEHFVPHVDHSVLSRTARNLIARQLDEVFAQWKVQ